MRGMSRPETCSPGQRYILYERDVQGAGAKIREVQFLAYLPCAGQVMITDHGKKEVVSRRDLFCVSGQLEDKRLLVKLDSGTVQGLQ